MGPEAFHRFPDHHCLEAGSLGLTNSIAAGLFNGASSYITVGTSGLPTGSNSRSVFAWIYAAQSSQLYPTVFGMAGSTKYQLGTSGVGAVPYQSFEVRSCLSTCVMDSRQFGANQWVMVGYTYSSATGYTTMYLNGIAGTPYAQAPTSPSTAYIGSDGSPNYLFNGSIADVQVYNTALTAAQVATLYANGLGASPIPAAGIAGWWPLNGNANDYGGNGNNGNPAGVAYTSVGENATIPNVAVLDGKNGFLQVPNVAQLQLSALTIAGWVNYRGGYPGYWNWLVAKQSAWGMAACGQSLVVCYYDWGAGAEHDSAVSLSEEHLVLHGCDNRRGH